MSRCLTNRPSNYIRWKLLDAGQSHLYWYQLCFILRMVSVCLIIVLILWNWPTLSTMQPVADKEFVKAPTNESDFTYPNDENIKNIDYRFSHPFENTCHFPMLQSEDSSILPFVEHARQVVCPNANFEHLISQDLDGVFLIGQPFGGKTPRSEIECFYRELDGALWPKIADYKLVGQWNRMPINKRFQIGKTQFVVKCWSNLTQHMVYHNAFANIPPKLSPPPVEDRYSIAILQIDSTSRNQFFRHAPKTLKFMRENEFQILRGYTKVGDNSAINSMALLAGRAFEAKYRGLDELLDKDQYLNENQTFDDIFKHVNMLFDDMKRDGCATMFNDDIGKATGGLFHYQAFNGFRKPPTDYYFRPYYTYIYRNLNAESVCVNGQFMIPKWLQLWERFSTLYKQKCHFSFNHISYFTHANGNNLELYDQPLVEALQRMKNAGVFDNTVLLILGDHGQRIHKIKFTHYGKVEERMPLAALYLPKKFRHSQPKLYQQLIRNTNRLTSTFDLHETLKELAQLRVSNKPTPITNNAKQTKQIGRSLFTEIPLDRECTDAKIPENFCVCMEEPEDNMDTTHLEAKMFVHIRKYFDRKLSSLSCITGWEMDDSNQTEPIVYAVTPLVRYGPRYIEEWEKRIAADPSKGNIFREIVELEQNATFTIQSKNGNTKVGNHLQLDATFRFQHNRISNTLDMLEEAWISNMPCSIFQLADLCTCFKKHQ